MEPTKRGAEPPVPDDIEALAARVATSGPHEAAELLRHQPAETVSATLQRINPSFAQDILAHLSESQRDEVIENAEAVGEQWERNLTYPEDSIGRLMERPVAVLTPEMSIGDAT